MNRYILLFIISFCLSKIWHNCNMFEDIAKYNCENTVPKELNKKCSYVNNKCISTYRNCEDYDGKDQKTCESISPEDFLSYKCMLEGKKCVQKERLCNELILPSTYDCQNAPVSDSSKKCVYSNGKCVEKYVKCEDYKENVNQNICELIEPQIEGIYGNYILNKCKYNNGKCEKEIRKCNDYKSEEDPYICSLLKANDPSKQCVYEDGKCEENYKFCEYYNNSITDTIDETICESIIIKDEHSKCVKKDGNCITEKKTCSDYSGKDYKICRSLLTKDASKMCTLIKGKCVEQYKKCEDYKEKNQKICISIDPYYSKYDEYDNDYDIMIKIILTNVLLKMENV